MKLANKIRESLVSIIIGTRPEAIKLAPVIKLFRRSSNVKTRLILTGQHKEMVDQVISLFDLEVDKNLK